MGEQMSKEAGGDHGHSHSHGGGGDHGHSHGGHGHSHGGHGHSHGGGHGHSHGGKPCHGHGGEQELPPIVQKRMKVAEVFLRVVLLKQLPGLFAKFHVPTPEEANAAVERQNQKQLEALKLAEKGEGEADKVTATVPDENDNADQFMTRAEFRKFLVITRCAGAAAFGFPVTRTREVAMMEAQILARARFDIRDPKVEVKIPQPMFLQIAAMLVRQVCVSNPESLGALMKMWGMDVAIPNLFIEPERAQFAQAMTYARDELAGAMLAFIEAKREENKDSAEPHVRAGFYSFIQSLIKGLEEANSQNEETKEMLSMFRMTPYEQMLPEFKQDPEDNDIEPRLLVNQAIQTVVAPLLLQDPEAMKHIAEQWGVEMNLVEEPDAAEGHGHSHGGVPCHGHGEAAEAKRDAAQPAHGHSHGGQPCHGHGEAKQAAPKEAHGHSHGGQPCHGHGHK